MSFEVSEHLSYGVESEGDWLLVGMPRATQGLTQLFVSDIVVHMYGLVR